MNLLKRIPHLDVLVFAILVGIIGTGIVFGSRYYQWTIDQQTLTDYEEEARELRADLVIKYNEELQECENRVAEAKYLSEKEALKKLGLSRIYPELGEEN